MGILKASGKSPMKQFSKVHEETKVCSKVLGPRSKVMMAGVQP